MKLMESSPGLPPASCDGVGADARELSTFDEVNGMGRCWLVPVPSFVSVGLRRGRAAVGEPP